MKQGEILFFLGSICIIVFAWIAFTVLHNSLTSTISQETIQTIIPIDGKFDTDTITAVKQRTVVLPLYTIQPQTQTAIVVTTATSSATGGQQQ